MIRQQNVFGFEGNAETCTEVHLSKTSYRPENDAALKTMLGGFQSNLDYAPIVKDYFILATILFKNNPGSAALYYKSALTALPAAPNSLRPRRILTDQLAMSLGMSGNLAEGRKFLESAIASDPDYPINYYNLACVDAEEGNATQAKIHLGLAFDRKANLIQGESMPDPTEDDSPMKLRNNKEFWDYVSSLPVSVK